MIFRISCDFLLWIQDVSMWFLLKMDTIFINLENSKTILFYYKLENSKNIILIGYLLLSLSDRTDLDRSGKYVAWSDQSIC